MRYFSYTAARFYVIIVVICMPKTKRKLFLRYAAGVLKKIIIHYLHVNRILAVII